MRQKLRLQLWHKLAQTTATPTTSGNTNVVAPPPQLNTWEAYPGPAQSYTQQQNTILNNLVHRLSLAVNQMTAGKYNFQELRNIGFNFDSSEFADPNTKNLMLFFLKVFKTLLNSGNSFATRPVDANQLAKMISYLMQAPELSNLSKVNPSGAIANQMPGNSSLAQTIRDTLQLMQPTAR